MLGVSFKAGTDDLRNSPAVELIEILAGKGFDIRLYDNNLQIARLTGKNKEYIESRIPHLSKLLTDDLNSLINNSDVLILSNNESEFKEALQNVSNKIIIDMIRIEDSIKQKNNYIGINW